MPLAVGMDHTVNDLLVHMDDFISTFSSLNRSYVNYPNDLLLILVSVSNIYIYFSHLDFNFGTFSPGESVMFVTYPNYIKCMFISFKSI